MDLSKIKSSKLIGLIENSERFNALSEAEKSKEIESISKLKFYQQDGVMSEFFAKSNAKEKEALKKKSQVLKEILEKIKEMDMIVGRMERFEVENIDQQKETKEEEELINQLNDL